MLIEIMTTLGALHFGNKSITSRAVGVSNIKLPKKLSHGPKQKAFSRANGLFSQFILDTGVQTK
jgi:hypothetical protein